MIPPAIRRLDTGSAPYDLWSLAVEDLAALPDCLSPAEKIQSQRFRHRRDHDRFLMRRLLVRHVLSLYAPLPPEAWEFTPNHFGRPELDPPVPSLAFNLTSSGNLALCAITTAGEIGVDLEDTHDDTQAALDLDLLVPGVLAPSERRSFDSLPPASRPAAFFRYWVLKESYAKARGLGLSLNVSQVAFPVEVPGLDEAGLALRATIPLALDPDPARWVFRTCRPTPCHIAAVAFRSRAFGRRRSLETFLSGATK